MNVKVAVVCHRNGDTYAKSDWYFEAVSCVINGEKDFGYKIYSTSN